MGLCGRGSGQGDDGQVPGDVLCGGERKRLCPGGRRAHSSGGFEKEAPGGIRPAADDHGRHRGRGLGEQLEGVLQASGDRRTPDGDSRLGGGGLQGPGGAAAESGAGLRHREPRHHPPVPDGAGKVCAPGDENAGPGLRQRDLVHCGAAAGGGERHGLRRGREGGGHRL